MPDLHALQAQDLKVLSAESLAELAGQMLAHIGEQARQIDSQAQGIKWRDAKIESITFQLARLKAWRFGTRTEAMSAEQRALFDETYAADEASLKQQLDALRGSTPDGAAGQDACKDKKPRQPKREALPEHLPRVDQRVEPEDTTCPTPECGKPMVRVGAHAVEQPDRGVAAPPVASAHLTSKRMPSTGVVTTT